MQAINDGGLVCVTCTDMVVLAGNSREQCYSRRGVLAPKSWACDKMALRIVWHSVHLHANCYQRYMVPLLSFSADFCVCFFLCSSSQARQRLNPQQAGMCSSVWVLEPCACSALGDPGGKVKFTAAYCPQVT